MTKIAESADSSYLAGTDEAEFEAWAESEGLRTGKANLDDLIYASVVTNYAWGAWRRARSTPPVSAAPAPDHSPDTGKMVAGDVGVKPQYGRNATNFGHPSISEVIEQMCAVATADEGSDLADEWPIDLRAQIDRWQAGLRVHAGNLVPASQPAAAQTKEDAPGYWAQLAGRLTIRNARLEKKLTETRAALAAAGIPDSSREV